MNPTYFLDQIKRIVVGGNGILKSQRIDLLTVRTTAGLNLTGITTPAVIASAGGSTCLVLSAVASSNVLGTFSFQIPQDYDQTLDKLRINLLAVSIGATNGPTITPTVYRKRKLTAISSDLAPSATAAVPKSATPAAIADVVVVNLDGKGCKGGDVLTVNLVTGAHTTDAIYLYGIDVEYGGGIVKWDLANR